MNNLFVDIIDESLDYKINIVEKALIKLFGIFFREDKLLNDKKSKTFFLGINAQKFSNRKNNIVILKKMLKRKISNIKNLNVVFSRPFDNIQALKKQIEEELATINKELSFIHSANNLNELDNVYISRYLLERKKDINKFKLLIVIDHIADFDYDRLIKYIEK